MTLPTKPENGILTRHGAPAYPPFIVGVILNNDNAITFILTALVKYFKNPIPNQKTVLLLQSKEDKVLHIAHQINDFIARTIIYSHSAKTHIDKKDLWFTLISSRRIQSYSTHSIQIHRNKTIEARSVSQRKRKEKFQHNKNRLTLADISEIAYTVGMQYQALNCSAQAAMAYYLLAQQGISAKSLCVHGIDHVYLGLEAHEKIFAIMDPWAGRIIPLKTPEAMELSKKHYQFFSNHLLEDVLFIRENNEEHAIRQQITLTP